MSLPLTPLTKQLAELAQPGLQNPKDVPASNPITATSWGACPAVCGPPNDAAAFNCTTTTYPGTLYALGHRL
eukprot:11186054-Heterocapsa_arctica.AAC.1